MSDLNVSQTFMMSAIEYFLNETYLKNKVKVTEVKANNKNYVSTSFTIVYEELATDEKS